MYIFDPSTSLENQIFKTKKVKTFAVLFMGGSRKGNPCFHQFLNSGGVYSRWVRGRVWGSLALVKKKIWWRWGPLRCLAWGVHCQQDVCWECPAGFHSAKSGGTKKLKLLLCSSCLKKNDVLRGNRTFVNFEYFVAEKNKSILIFFFFF